MAHRFASCKGIRNGEPILTDSGGRFRGTVIPRTDHLSIPLKRRKPTVYAVWNDLFHEAVPLSFVEDAFEIMRGTYPRHEFLVLTKRPERMVKYWQWRKDTVLSPGQNSVWPANVYPGLTIGNQQEADKKIPVFIQAPGKKFLSIEPMLGDINLSWSYHNFLEGWDTETEAEYDHRGNPYPVPVQVQTEKIDAVILGGGSGPGARPMHPDWVRSVRDQCAAAGAPFFFKGWGEWAPAHYYGNYVFLTEEGKGGGPVSENVLKQTIAPNQQWMARVGKKAAGRLLDGKEYNSLPWVKSNEK